MHTAGKAFDACLGALVQARVCRHPGRKSLPRYLHMHT